MGFRDRLRDKAAEKSQRRIAEAAERWSWDIAGARLTIEGQLDGRRAMIALFSDRVELLEVPLPGSSRKLHPNISSVQLGHVSGLSTKRDGIWTNVTLGAVTPVTFRAGQTDAESFRLAVKELTTAA